MKRRHDRLFNWLHIPDEQKLFWCFLLRLISLHHKSENINTNIRAVVRHAAPRRAAAVSLVMAVPGVVSHFHLIASDGLSLSLLLSHSRHISGELMRMRRLAWLILISSEGAHTDGKFPDGDRWSATFNLSRGFRPTKAALEKEEWLSRGLSARFPLFY